MLNKKDLINIIADQQGVLDTTQQARVVTTIK